MHEGNGNNGKKTKSEEKQQQQQKAHTQAKIEGPRSTVRFFFVWFARVACSTVVTLCAADSSFVQLPARESCCKEKKKKNSRRKKKKDM